MERKKKINPALTHDYFVYFDGLARQRQTQLTSDPDCTSGDKTDTTYDATGRVHTVSNLYCSTSDSTYGKTTYTYDALGRTCVVAPPTGTPQSNCPSGAIAGDVVTVYGGRATEVFDEGNGTQSVARISQTDGLDRLVSVCEVTGTSLIGSGGTPGACGLDISATGFLTTYQYDALDNLFQVNQSGVGARTFNYDSLSRLTSAGNPESGTTSYTYDANGNLHTKTDARNITTCFGDWTGTTCNGATGYDALNRILKKTYSDGTPAATFNYDQTSALGVTLTNTTGRKSSETTAGSFPTGSVFSYDPMGRLANNSQCTPQNCGSGVFAIQYPQYDFVGNLLTGTNAAGVTFTYTFNTAARLTGISSNYVDPSHPGTLLSQATYNAPGLLRTVLLGNGLTETRNYDPRLRLTSLAAGTVYSLNMASYAPNGDVLAANDSVNGNWVYKYDDFNRLICSNLASNGTCLAPTSGTATYTYKYDRFGNRWQQNGPQSFVTTFTGNNPSNPQNNNRMDGYSYDAAGNLLSDGTHGYSYDAENRLTNVDNGTTASYVYDAEDRRVRKATASGTLDFLYDAQGHKVAEVDTTATFQRGELYAGGRHFAVFAPDPGPTGATFFIHADWLATERARTSMSGTTCENITSLPFGDGQTISDSCGDSAGDVSPMHFTGKERDAESGLDNFGARYDSSSMGRFMSPDPINLTKRRLVNPANTLNKYTYAANNPIKYFDPDGKDVTVFYSREGLGHISLTAFDQEKGAVRSLDFNPDIRNKSSDYKTFFGGSSTPTFAAPKEPSAIVSDNYASITIRTTPDEARKVINWIDQLEKNPQDYNLWTNNCTSVCIEALKVLGIETNGGALTDDPDDLWDQLYQKFSDVPAFAVGHYPAQPGREYGFQRYPGINTYQLADLYFRLWFYEAQPPPKACVETIDSATGSHSKSCD